jgi:uncharacterized membrane protein YdbT with pleckstrin-like domain
MSYIEESLSKGEEIINNFPHHGIVKFNQVGHFIIALFTLGVWLPIAIWHWLYWKNIEQAVTSKRVIHKYGIVSRKTKEMRINAIESITIKQGIIGRIFGFGTVTVTGRGAGDVDLKWMKDPMMVKRDIENVAV